MKKTIPFLLGIFLAVSCSSDSDNTIYNSILVKKEVLIIDDTQQVALTTNYTYDGRKLSTKSYNNYLFKYYYDGDLIVKMETYFNNNLIGETNYSYDNAGRLIQSKDDNFSSNASFRFTYEHHADNTVLVKYYVKSADTDFDPATNDVEHLESTSKYFFDVNNQLLKTEDYIATGTKIIQYTYDNKPNPYKNVIGMDKIIKNGTNFNIKTALHSGATEPAVMYVDQIYAITYNSNHFPVKKSIVDNGMTNQYYYY